MIYLTVTHNALHNFQIIASEISALLFNMIDFAISRFW